MPPGARSVIDPVLGVRVVRGPQHNPFVYPTNLAIVDDPDGGLRIQS